VGSALGIKELVFRVLPMEVVKKFKKKGGEKMATNERKEGYVTLHSREIDPVTKRLIEGEPITYDTLEKAVGALDDLGICMNWGMVTKIKNSFSMLVYEGWVYRHTYERRVFLPFNEDNPKFGYHFERLLKKTFEPFILRDDDIHRSLINVIPALAEKECFFVTLLLIFPEEETAERIQKVLREIEDGHDDVSGRIFWLD
jgi:hypothetical protein